MYRRLFPWLFLGLAVIAGGVAIAAAPVDKPSSLGPFFRMADTNGDGTGTKNIIGDMSSGDGVPVMLTAKADERLDVYRMLVFIEDSANPSADVYGNLASALSHGINIYKTNASDVKVQDITDPDTPIVSNATWSIYNYDVTPVDFGAGNDGVVVRWTFANAGMPIRLNEGESIVIDMDDDFTGLVRHYFEFQGVRRHYP